MATPLIKGSFSAGEVTPSLYGRLDLQKWHSACSVARNFFVSYKGGMLSRGGLAYVGVCKQPASADSLPPRNIEFTFNIFQSYILEFGANYMRVIANGGYVTEGAFAISAATQAYPCALTIPGNNYLVDDWVYVTGVVGMTQLNGRIFRVRSNGATITFNDVFGNPVNSQTYGAYVSGGTAARIFTLATPYAAADLPYLKFTQSADVMSLTCVNQQTQTEYPTLELSRLAANNWTLAPPAFASSIGAPATCSITGTVWNSGASSPNPGPVAYGYVVTAIDPVTGDESEPSPIGSATGIVDISGQFGTVNVSWTPPASAPNGVASYNIYRATPDYTNVGDFIGQIFGYVGSSLTTNWQDTNIVADFTTTPPSHTNPFAVGQITGVGAIPQQAYATFEGTISGTTLTVTNWVGPDDIANGMNLNGPGVAIGTTISSGGPGTNGTYTISQAPANNITEAIGMSAGSFGPGTTTATINTNTGAGGQIDPAIGNSNVLAGIIDNPGQDYQSTDTVTFTDSSTNATVIAPLNVGPQSGNNPGVVSYFQQRRFYAYSINEPDQYEASQTGSFYNFDQADPPIDSDAFSGTPWAEQINGIQWLMSMPGGLVAFTGKTTWQLSGANSSAGFAGTMTPSSQVAVAQEAIGCSPTLPPIRVRYNLLFGESLTGVVNEVNYNFFFNIYTGQDITVLSSQLFQGFTLKEWALAFDPYRVIWGVRNDGKLLSLTYVQEQEVRGWARHDTNGLFQSVAVASEPPVNAPYFIVKRYIIGENQWAYVQERMDNRLWNNVEQSFCLDSALSLPQPTPNANLTASAAQGEGAVILNQITLGGENYTNPSGVIEDLAGTGSGAAVTAFALTGGAISGVTIVGGKNYQKPVIKITDSTGQGAVISLAVDNSVTFTADANVFSAGNVGNVLRMGGGIGVVSSYVSPTMVIAQVPPQAAITATVPNDPNNMPVPATSGNWTLTAPVQTVSGLEHLNGMTVNALADGFPVLNLVVANGMVTLPNAASSVVIGLSFIAQAQSMHADLGAEMIQGKRKRIQGCTIRLANTRGIYIGQDQPVAAQQPNQEELPWNVAPNLMTQLFPEVQALAGPGNALPLFSGDRYVPIAGDYSTTNGQPSPGMAAVLQILPLPCELLAFIPELELGDVPNG